MIDQPVATLMFGWLVAAILAVTAHGSEVSKALFLKTYGEASLRLQEAFSSMPLRLTVIESYRFIEAEKNQSREMVLSIDSALGRIDHRILASDRAESVGDEYSEIWGPNGWFAFRRHSGTSLYSLSRLRGRSGRNAFSTQWGKHFVLGAAWSFYDLTIFDYLQSSGVTIERVYEREDAHPYGKVVRVEFTSRATPVQRKGWFELAPRKKWVHLGYDIAFYSKGPERPTSAWRARVAYEGEYEGFPIVKNLTVDYVRSSEREPWKRYVGDVVKVETRPEYPSDYFTPAAFGLTDPAAPQRRDLTWPVVLAGVAAALLLLAYYRRRRRRAAPGRRELS